MKNKSKSTRAFLLFISELFLIVSFFLTFNFDGKIIDIIGYFDEIITIVFTILLIIRVFNKPLSKKYKYILICFSFLIVIGLISNLSSHLLNSTFGILTDALMFFKVFIPFLYVSLTFNQNDKECFVRLFYKFAYLFIIISSIFAIVNLFVDLNIGSGDVRYGIRSYSFVFKNEARFGLVISTMLLIILESDVSNKKKRFFEILVIMNLLLTTKTTIFLIVILYVFFNVFSKYNISRKTFIITIGIVGIVCIILFWWVLEKYLFTPTAIRSVLIRYGFVTANDYFPLGSGFGTYGSETAATYYSSLYDKYGFENYWGLSREYSQYLNDNYLASIVGQFGYFGFIAFYLALFLCLTIVYKCSTGYSKSKYLIYSIYLVLCISTIGTAILKSQIGLYCLLFVAVFCQRPKRNNRTESIEKGIIYE